jgi:hypothetical protein
MISIMKLLKKFHTYLARHIDDLDLNSLSAQNWACKF